MKRKSTKGLALTLAAVMAATIFSGCGSSSTASSATSTVAASSTAASTGADSSAKTDSVAASTATSTTASTSNGSETTIKFGIHVADPEKQETVTYNIVEAFNKKYAGKYKVEFEAAEKSAHDQNMKLEAADGTLPEIFWMDSAMAPEFSSSGYLLDLSDFLSQNADTDKALDSSVKEAFNDGTTQYGLPYQCNVEGFFYNKKVLSDNGIAEPTNGTTYEDFLNMIDKLNAAGITPIAQGSKDNYAIWSFLAVLDRYGYSDKIYDILKAGKGFDDPDLVKCFDKLSELGTKKAFPSNMSSLSYFDSKALFEAGTAAFIDTGAWDCAEFDQKIGDNIGFWWGPVFSDSTYEQKTAMKVPSAPICVSAAVGNDAAKKEAVYAFLNYYYSKDAANISYAGSCFPATNYTDVTISDTQYAMKAVTSTFADGWTSPKAQPDQILSSAVQTQLYDSMLGVMLGNYKSEEALQKIDSQLANE